jgi:hypothetical protein
MIAADDKELRAGRGILAGWIVVNAAVVHVEALDDAITYRSATLDDPPAHKRYVVTTELVSRV